jgi:SAM-dependent methyltransferase
MKIYDYSLSSKALKYLVSSTYNNLSLLRTIHNFFLLNYFNINSGKSIDLGSGNSESSTFLDELIKKKFDSIQIIEKVDLYKSNSNYKIIDLEKKLNLKDNSYNNVILFNVLEHIQNYQSLLSEITRILQKKGRLEIFVPFMLRYHKDPLDIFRPTHYYINELLKKDYEVDVTLIGAGPFLVIAEILTKYVKLKFLKILLVLIMIILNKIAKRFSKDFDNYYLGIHCSCIKK